MKKKADVIISVAVLTVVQPHITLPKEESKDVLVLEADDSIGHLVVHQETVVVSVSPDVMSENFRMRCMRSTICGRHFPEELGVDVEYYQRGNFASR